jgi:NADH-ubiquinone oxidoreductase chain 5
MYLSIIILPLLSSLVSGFLGRKVGVTGSQIITCGSLIITSVFLTIAFYEVGICGSPVKIEIINWLDIEILNISWSFYFDQLTVSLGLAVIYCSTLIHIYSIDYLSTDPHIQRFFAYLSAFTAGMLVLICGGNFLVMFVGWESIGVASYLLINYYFTRIQANKAAILAFTMNRGGDMLMSIGFFAIFSIFGSLNYSEIFSLVPFINETTITILSLFLLGGALAKSANIPLHSWLPGSMEAPTPVSALLHAATLVTAGIYLLIRVSPILEYSSTALLVITIIGSTTAFIAATSGLLANDLKRIIAFSTISQLGYMMMAIGLSQYNVALMHTVNHAFFKALLFLGAGAVIHSFADQQDIRKMGGLIKFLPFTYSVMLTGSLSLLATPYLTGFYSKDLILELAYGQYNFSGIYAYILGSITAGITAFYSFRLISLVFLTTPNGNKQSYFNSCPHVVALPKATHSQEACRFRRGPRSGVANFYSYFKIKNKNAALAAEKALVACMRSKMKNREVAESKGDSKKFLSEKLNLIVIFPLLILAIFSIFFGFVFSDLFVGIGSDFFKNSIFMHPKNISLIEAEFALSFDGPLMGPVKAGYGETSLSQVNNIFIKLLPAILSFTGAFSAFILYHLQHPSTQRPPIPAQRQATQQMQSLEMVTPALPTATSQVAIGEGLFLINLTNNKIGKIIYAFLNGKYFFDIIYNHFFIQRGLNLGYNISKEIDRGAIELLGPYGLSNYFYNAGKNLAKLDTGVITTYSLYITIALISLLFILFYPVLELTTNYISTPPLAGSATLSATPSATPTATQSNDPQSLEELRLFIIYITSALIVLSPYPSVFLYKIKN